jgi:hypothetical protein
VNLHNDEGFGRNEHIGQGVILRLLIPSGTPVPKNTSTIARTPYDGGGGGGGSPEARKTSIWITFMCLPDEHVGRRTGLGLLRSTRRECVKLALDAGAAILLKSEFFSMCMTLILREGVSLIAFTY